MKMTELRAENESLKQQIQLLQQKEGEKDASEIAQLKDKNRSLRKNIKDLKAEKIILSGKIQALESDNSSKDQENLTLRAEAERLQQQITELSDIHAKTISEVEALRTDQKTLLERTSQLQSVQAELNRLQQVENECSEKTAQVVTLQTELDQRGHLLEELQAKSLTEVQEYKDQLVKISNEMELVRKSLQAELDTYREQSGVEIDALQTQKNGLNAKIIDLTEKLKLVATHLEKQMNEKRKIASQHDTAIKEFQTYKEKAEKQINDLMALLQKMAAELDAARAAHPIQETQTSIANGDKPTKPIIGPAANKQPQWQLQELQRRLTELDQINANQAREMADLSARIKHINQALSTPFGRFASQLLGLKDK